jgi:hypothetical protein
MRYAVSDLDIFFISFDETMAEAHYRDLCTKCPRPVKRVHGIRGIHAAHRACSDQSETERFVTVDADNVVNAPLFFQRFNTAPEGRDLIVSFKARSPVTGLEYGQGGVKIWPRGLIGAVPTHETAEDEVNATDFCFGYRFEQANFLASTTHHNCTPLEAFRTGYREAVKLTLIMGRRLDRFEAASAELHPLNRSRLLMWLSMGADVENGWWSIYGARQGLYDLWIADQPVVSLINDFTAFSREFARRFAEREPDLAAREVGRRIESLGLSFADLDASASRMVRASYQNPDRSGIMLPQMSAVPF